MAASPYTRLDGDDQYLHQLFCLGIGDMEISSIKIGSTPIEDFNDCLYEIITYDPNDKNGPKVPKYYPTGIYETNENIKLEQNINNIRTTQECDKAEIDLSFQGLCWMNDQGNPENAGVNFTINYKPHDGTAWKSIGMSKYFNGYNNKVKKGYRQGDSDSDTTYVVGIQPETETGIFRREAQDVHDNEIRLGYYTEIITDVSPVASNPDSDFPPPTIVKYTCKFRADRKLNGYVISGFNAWANSGYYPNLKECGLCVSGGTVSKAGENGETIETHRIEGSQTTLLRKTISIEFEKRGTYDICVTRTSADNNDNTRLRNDAYWTALRSVTNDAPVQTKYPVMLLSLQIRASGQLSGSIDTLTVYYKTKILAPFDKNKKDADGNRKWEKGYTSNPAAIFRYILQQGDAFARPQANALIDLKNLETAYDYFERSDFETKEGAKHWKYGYDKVMDSSVSVFDRLSSICASALSSPTMVDGKWGIIIDKERENVVCAFTSANAWNWKFERTQIRLPHEIHCSFISRETWDADMRVVPTDEVEKGGEARVHETQEYDGVTDPRQIYQLARFHYADAKMRRRLITFKCFDEAILCTRGDLVELACPNINVTGLQVGRIRKINKDSLGRVVSFTTDQINTTDLSQRTFGVRIYSNSGEVFHSVVMKENTSQRLITLQTPVKMDIQPGNKYAFGDYKLAGYDKDRPTEVIQAVVLGLKFNSDWTCDVTCQDYTPDIYGDLSKEIPEFKSIITKAIDFKWELTGIPIIRSMVSDERALQKGVDGVLSCRILVNVSDPKNIDPKAALYYAEIRSVSYPYREEPTKPKYGQWRVGAINIPIEQSSFYINNVSDQATYQIRIRYAGRAGEYGAWCKEVTHKIAGKLAIPPDVTGFKAEIDNPSGVKLSWDMLKVLDIAHYEIVAKIKNKGTNTFSTAYISPSTPKKYTPTTPKESPYFAQFYKQVGDIFFDIVGVDTGGRKSKNAATASVTIKPPKDVSITSAQLLNAGIVVKWASSFVAPNDKDNPTEGGWNIASYSLSGLGLELETPFHKGVLVLEDGFIFPGTGQVTMSARDIFNNTSGQTSQTIDVYKPQKPTISLGFDKRSGEVVLTWQDCRSQQVLDSDKNPLTPTIAYYELRGTLAANAFVKVYGLQCKKVVPLVVYEKGTLIEEEGIKVKVGTLNIELIAVDKYGIRGEEAIENIPIYPPLNPTDFVVTPIDTALRVKWRNCERTFSIDHYEVYDSYIGKTENVDINEIFLCARPKGSYEIKVTAFDTMGWKSATMSYNVSVEGIGAMIVTHHIEGGEIVLEWNKPRAPFQIDHYSIYNDNDKLPNGKINTDKNGKSYVGSTKKTTYRIPANFLGSLIYYVWAVDIAGNINTEYANCTQVTIVENEAPTVSVALAKDRDKTKNDNGPIETKDGLVISWTPKQTANALPIQEWEVLRYRGDVSAADLPTKSPVQNYGRIKANKLSVKAFSLSDNGNDVDYFYGDGTKTRKSGKTFTFAVCGIDSLGKQSAWGVCNFAVEYPGRIYFTNEVVIDNNVQLYWQQPSDQVFFPIREYLVDQIEDTNLPPMRIGTVDALFASAMEEENGQYTYGVTPVDIGGNMGTTVIVTLQVSQPPDFIFFGEVKSLFNGYAGNKNEVPEAMRPANSGRTNFMLDGNGGMIGPVPVGETWQANMARMKGLTNEDIVTHQQKIAKGWKTWLEPALSEASYTEVINHGDVIPSTNYKVNITSFPLSGDPVITCQVELSKDGVEWRIASRNATMLYVTDFQYSRVTIKVTGGLIRISGLQIRLDVKKIMDFGRVECLATDNGTGWKSEAETPMLTGKWVNFRVNFIDVQSFPRPTVVIPNEKKPGDTTDYSSCTAFVVFEDVLRPKGFRVFVKDKNGNRVSAYVDWNAFGV